MQYNVFTMGLSILMSTVWTAGVARGAETSIPTDSRLEHCRTLNDRMTLQRFASLEDWESYGDWLRRHILVSTGLWPLPERTPLKAHVYGEIVHEDYRVSKVYFESRPGFFVCGNLYRPRDQKGDPYPGILCPHGHWGQGRFGHLEQGCVRARMISFARQGYVAFSWSMVGYNEANQIGHKRGISDVPWGVSLMGLQLWNSIRACDFLSGRPDVDRERIGCTGASGGGTQTFMLTAVDERVKVAAPVNMISAIMQGGCECENAPLLRLSVNNVEIASLMAPRPLLMVSATGDWTKNTLELEYPGVRSVYQLYGAAEKVRSLRIDAPHNYNLDSRNAVYPFFARWLKGAKDYDGYQETALEIDKTEDLVVFNEGHPRPDYAVDREGLRTMLIAESRGQLAAYRPRDKAGLERFREVYGSAYEHLFQVRQPTFDEVGAEEIAPILEGEGYTVRRHVMRVGDEGWVIPTLVFIPADVQMGAPVVLIVHADGKEVLWKTAGHEPIPLVRQLLARGYVVGGFDCFLTGAAVRSGDKAKRPKAPAHDLTYNRTDLAWRVQDILTCIGRSQGDQREVNVVGLGRAGLWVLAARPLARHVRKTVVDAGRFDPERDENWEGDLLLPGIRRAGELQTAGILTAPNPLLIHNTGEAFPTGRIREGFRSAGAEERLRIEKEALTPEQIVDYLRK